MRDECTWHHKTFLVQSVYWHLAIKLYCIVTSTEARRPIRDGDEWEKGDRRVKPRIRRQPGRPRLLWTAARTTECYGSVRPALRSNHRTTRLLSQLLSKITYYNRCCCAEQSHKDNVRSSAVGNSWSKRSPTFKPSSPSQLLISSRLTWGSSNTSLFLISPEITTQIISGVSFILSRPRYLRMHK